MFTRHKSDVQPQQHPPTPSMGSLLFAFPPPPFVANQQRKNNAML